MTTGLYPILLEKLWTKSPKTGGDKKAGGTAQVPPANPTIIKEPQAARPGAFFDVRIYRHVSKANITSPRKYF